MECVSGVRTVPYFCTKYPNFSPSFTVPKQNHTMKPEPTLPYGACCIKPNLSRLGCNS